MYNMGENAARYLAKNLIDSQGLINEAIYRDCSHPQYTLHALGHAAEIAHHQGSDELWEQDRGQINDKPRLLEATEFFGQMFPEGPYPSQCKKTPTGPTKPGAMYEDKCYWYPDVEHDLANDYDVNIPCGAATIYSGFEVLYNHYRLVMEFPDNDTAESGGNMSELKQFVTGSITRPSGTFTFRPDHDYKYVPGWSTLTHANLGDP